MPNSRNFKWNQNVKYTKLVGLTNPSKLIGYMTVPANSLSYKCLNIINLHFNDSDTILMTAKVNLRSFNYVKLLEN